MSTTTTTAAQESAKNVKIYGLMAEVARKAFEYLTIVPGQYTAPQVVAALKKGRAKWDDLTPGVADPDGLAAIACEGFECKYPLQMAFDMLAQVATAYDIPTADRATFERAAESAPVLLTLDVPTAAREVAKAVSKKDTGAPAITFAYFDTKRRALVGTNRQVLTVAAAPFAEVAPEAADTKGFLIPVSLLRSHRVTIDNNNNATDGHKVLESPNWHRWPNWESIFPQVHDTDALTLSKATARELTKAVATAAKFATAETGPNGLTKYVAIFGEAYTDRLTVRARHLVGDRFEYHDVTVRLAADLGRSFALAVSGDDFATLPTFDTLFVPANHRPAIVTSAHAVALIFALTLPEDFATICDTDTPPTWAKVVEPLADLLGVVEPCPLTTDTPEADTIATATTCEAVESVAPADTKADPCEAVSEPESEPQGDTLTTDPEAVEIVTTWASPYAIACELPTADGIESEPTPQADTLTPPPADTIESVAPVLTIERPRHHWHPRRALRTVLRVAALIVAALLLTLTADRVETTKADTLITDPEAVAIADTLRAADLLTADTIATATTCEAVESVESVTPDTHKGEAIKYAHEPRKRATRHDPDTLAQVATADTIATAATCEAVESVADTLRAADLLTTDTLTADTIATATTCEAVESVEGVAPAETKADTIEAVSEPESEPQGDTLTTDPVSHEGNPVAPADPEGDTLPTPTPATGGTPAPVPVSPAVLAWLLTL